MQNELKYAAPDSLRFQTFYKQKRRKRRKAAATELPVDGEQVTFGGDTVTFGGDEDVTW